MIRRRVLLALSLFAVFVTSPLAHATEVVPSLGMSRNPSYGDAAKVSYGLALRHDLAPFMSGELGVGYRQDQLQSGTIESTQWPVTLSLWFKPIPAIYLGGGTGLYNTTMHYPNSAITDKTTNTDFGLHVGGGVVLPMIPGLASLDVSGRYVRLGTAITEVLSQSILSDYWTTSLGVAFQF
ncbi:MAG: outer membrane beta-barrel protein [bacterium]